MIGLQWSAKKSKGYETDEWLVMPRRYLHVDHTSLSKMEALFKHLVFVLKYEDINLLVFSFMTKTYNSEQIRELVRLEPTGQYSRRMWFLVEWITQEPLIGKEYLSKKKLCANSGRKITICHSGHKIPTAFGH